MFFFPPEYHPRPQQSCGSSQEVKRAVLSAIAPMASVEQVRALRLDGMLGWVDPNLKWNTEYPGKQTNDGIWMFPKTVVPEIIHYNHPFWGTTIFGNTHI